MSRNGNDLPDAEERPSIGEVIREWAVSAAAIVIIVFGIGYGIISIIRTEIRPIEQTVSSFESRFEKVDEQLVRADAKADAWFEKLDERLARAEAKADKRFEKLVESVNQMNKKMDAHLTLHKIKNDAQPNASLSDPDGEAPVKPLAESAGTESSSSG